MKDSPNYYAIIPASVRYDENLPSKAPLLYGEITALCNKEGFCWASDDYFKNLYGVSRATVQSWLKSLEEGGYITREVVFKKDSKEIEKRYIRILDKVVQKTRQPLSEKLENPSPENKTDNNTNNNNTSNNTNNSAAKPAQLTLKNEFEQLWKNYPNKKDKGKAFNHYKAWRKKSVKNTNEYLEQKLADYLRYCALKKDWYHPMNGSTWFNGRFDDDLDLGGAKNDPWSRHYE